MVNPKYAPTHSYFSFSHFKSSPHVVNLYLDYNCPFSAKLFLNFRASVIPLVEKTFPGKFQFDFINVVQPWHPNSVYLNEFALSVSKVLRENEVANANGVFWDVSEVLFKNKEKFYDNANVGLNRNEVYGQIFDVVSHELKVPFTREQVLANLTIDPASGSENYSNAGNAVGADIKYFTRFHRTVGVHITPTISVDGITNGQIESSTDAAKVVEILKASL